ncbi:hypothetical protein CSOJ01_14688 [Colletotrichum sojae]|uniref:Uncharacterized protein n=1 Tax=Colletotrichum sojae TaxID=2175907 RepID=A0A8H6MJV3_9PEZI|nr:hypothetical protein CSOJ01_14688 [Colletotrichum sojae]
MKFAILFTTWTAVALAASVSYDEGASLFARQDTGEAVCANCQNSVSCNGVKFKKTAPRGWSELSKRQQEAEIKNVCNNCHNNVVCAGSKIASPEISKSGTQKVNIWRPCRAKAVKEQGYEEQESVYLLNGYVRRLILMVFAGSGMD